jgi:hypothetical protein
VIRARLSIGAKPAIVFQVTKNITATDNISAHYKFACGGAITKVFIMVYARTNLKTATRWMTIIGSAMNMLCYNNSMV